MLLLLFRTGDSLYAFDTADVVEVVPRVPLRAVPHAPPFLAGLLSYRGKAVPVVDFGALVGGPPARQALGTRLILVGFTGQGGAKRLVGVIAEDVSALKSVAPGHDITPPMGLEDAPYLGSVLRLEEGLVQLVVVDSLLSSRVQDALYGGPAEPR